jgi:GntR family transcriptional regulator/MocR family aminotransferase
VTAAYNQLISEGYLVTRPGARAVVAEGLGAAATPTSAPAVGPRHLSAFAQRLLAQPPLPPTQPVRLADFRYGDLSGADFPATAWRRALNRASLRRTARLRYDDPQGSASLRAALQGYLWRARGISCAPDQIVVVNGSQQGLDLCARLLLDPGDQFVIENPGYLLARQPFAAAGGVAVPVPVDGEGLRTDLLPAARLAYVTPSHQFPLGHVLSAGRRRALLVWAAHSGAYVIEDDYDGEYRHDVAPIPPLRTLDPESVIYVGTFSKTLSPTLRLGYLVVPSDLARAFGEAKRLTDRHTALPEQDALADLLASGVYERHVRSIRRKNAERRAVLLQAIADHLGSTVTVVGADTGLHVVIWIDGVPAEREPAMVAAARAAGIGLYPVSPLYDPAGPRPTAAGFTLGYAGLEADALRRGIAVLARVEAEHR